MVEAGLSFSGIAGVLNGAGAGRLRPTRPEEGLGLVWDTERPALSVEPGLPPALPLFMPDPAPLGWPLPPAWDAFLWSSGEWAAPAWVAEFHANPERHSTPDDIRLPPGLLPDIPAWLPPPAPVTEPETDGREAGAVPPRPPGLPAPLFPPPVLEGGALREVSVPEGQADAIHQPSVTDRPAEGLGWRITGGADAELLMMDPAAGTLRFLTAPDAAQPADADGDNRYEVIFEVRDGWGAASTQHLTVTVTDSIWG